MKRGQVLVIEDMPVVQSCVATAGEMRRSSKKSTDQSASRVCRVWNQGFVRPKAGRSAKVRSEEMKRIERRPGR